MDRCGGIECGVPPKEVNQMALKMTRYSDKSGTLIPEGAGVRIRIEFLDGKTVARSADLTRDEVDELLPFAHEVSERPSRQTRSRSPRN